MAGGRRPHQARPRPTRKVANTTYFSRRAVQHAEPERQPPLRALPARRPLQRLDLGLPHPQLPLLGRPARNLDHQSRTTAPPAHSAGNTRLHSRTYGIEVDVRDADPRSLRQSRNLSYTLNGCAGPGSAQTRARPSSGHQHRADRSAPAGQREYRSGQARNGLWTIAQDFSPSTTYSWNTAGKLQGHVRPGGRRRNHRLGLGLQTVANVSFALTIPRARRAAHHGQVLAAAHGTTGADRLSHLRRHTRVSILGRDLSGRWTIVQDFGAAARSAGTRRPRPGTYGLEVDVRNQSSTASTETSRTFLRLSRRGALQRPPNTP